MTLYHYSDTEHLLRILAAGELRPTLFDNGMTDFLWATISTRPEPTSRAILFPGILWAYTRLVRFVLPSKGFVRFDEQAIVRHWGREHLDVLENEIRSFGRPLVETWRVHIGPPAA